MFPSITKIAQILIYALVYQKAVISDTDGGARDYALRAARHIVEDLKL